MSNSYDAMPTGHAAAVTTNNGADLPGGPCRSIYVGVSGDVKVDMAGSGTGITYKAMPVGWHPIKVKKIYATGTTATDIIAVY